MLNKKEIIGIDIGTRIIKVLELKISGDKISVVQCAQRDIGFADISEKSPEEKKSTLSEALKILIESNKFSTKQSSISVSGSSVIVRLVKFPKMSLEDIESTLEFEAEPHIPFDIQEVYLATQIIGDVPEAEQPQMEAVLVAGKEETIREKLDIIEMAGLKPAVIDVDSFAVSNAYEIVADIIPDSMFMLVNIGASITNISIVKDGISRVVRDLYTAGNSFTKTIRENLQISMEQAEDYKIKYGLSGSDPSKFSDQDKFAPKIYEILKPIVKELNSEMQRSIDYFTGQQTSSDVNIDKIILSGGSAALKGLSAMIQTDLGIPVEIFRPLENLDTSKIKGDFDISSPGLAVVMGLALRRIGDHKTK